MLHGSRLSRVITSIDLTGAGRIVASRYYTPFEAFIAVGVPYFCITLALAGGFKLLEQRWFAHLRPREEPTARQKGRPPAEVGCKRGGEAGVREGREPPPVACSTRRPPTRDTHT